MSIVQAGHYQMLDGDVIPSEANFGSLAPCRIVSMKKPCLFCVCPPEQILIDGPIAMARIDTHPVSPGHTLIIPRRHVVTLFETTEEERLAMFRLLDQAKAILDKDHKPDGYNIGINSGPAAGQTVMHLHMHLIPRYKGDKADPRGGVRWVLPENAAYWKK
jgi:diadenosine tetraphosphate (Ap4A) HIT family hydrolase